MGLRHMTGHKYLQEELAQTKGQSQLVPPTAIWLRSYLTGHV